MPATAGVQSVSAFKAATVEKPRASTCKLAFSIWFGAEAWHAEGLPQHWHLHGQSLSLGFNWKFSKLSKLLSLPFKASFADNKTCTFSLWNGHFIIVVRIIFIIINIINIAVAILLSPHCLLLLPLYVICYYLIVLLFLSYIVSLSAGVFRLL